MAKALEPKNRNTLKQFISENVQKFTAVRDYLKKEITEMALPWEPLPCHSGYFLMADVTKCRDLIPRKYFQSHEYEPETTDEKMNKLVIKKHELYMPNTSKKTIPLNLAFARWMAVENKVTMMPNCHFYHKDSVVIDENHVRLAICKDIASVKEVCKRLRKI